MEAILNCLSLSPNEVLQIVREHLGGAPFTAQRTVDGLKIASATLDQDMLSRIQSAIQAVADRRNLKVGLAQRDIHHVMSMSESELKEWFDANFTDLPSARNITLRIVLVLKLLFEQQDAV
jgi:hypothetical protein